MVTYLAQDYTNYGQTWNHISTPDPVLPRQQCSLSELKTFTEGFPAGAVVKNLPANAGDTGSSPGLGRSHMPRSNQAREPQLLAIAEPARLEPVLRNKRGRDSERPAHRDEEWPPLSATGESPRTETKTQHSQK